MELREALLDDIWIIQLVAKHTWRETFKEILPEEQIRYMMEMMYSTASLEKQIQSGHHYILAQKDDEYLGYLSFEKDYQNQACLKVHKIYVMPTAQGRGVGSTLLHYAESEARKLNQTKISLNVNRDNQAKIFYKKMGFKIVGEEDIDIGNGYLMEDYIMHKKL